MEASPNVTGDLTLQFRGILMLAGNSFRGTMNLGYSLLLWHSPVVVICYFMQCTTRQLDNTDHEMQMLTILKISMIEYYIIV